MVKEMAGYSDFANTQLYIEVANEMRRLAADRVGNRAQRLAAESPQQDSPTARFAPKQGRRTDLIKPLKSVG